METILLRIEKKGRGGKMVTLLDGFTHSSAYIKDLARQIKRSCGTGGALKGLTIEIQGDFRVQIREILQKEGFQIKG